MRKGNWRRRRLSALAMFVLVLVGAVALTLGLRAIQTVAQDGLPTPEGRLGGAISVGTQAPAAEAQTPTPTPRRLDIPAPADCDIEPRTIDDILSLVPGPSPSPQQVGAIATPQVSTSAAIVAATPAAIATGTMTATATATAAPGTPVDRPATAAMVGQIQRAVREMTACGNAGELLSVWAFFTDEFVADAAPRQGNLFNRTILSARVRASVERQDVMPTVSNVRTRTDGRITAQVTVPIGSPFSVITSQTGAVTCEWALDSSRWRIDRVLTGDGTGGP